METTVESKSTGLIRLNIKGLKPILLVKDLERFDTDLYLYLYNLDLNQNIDTPEFLFFKGYCYYNKINVPRKDTELGISLMKAAADAGLFEAMIVLSNIRLLSGFEKPDDPSSEETLAGYDLREKAIALLSEEYNKNPDEKNTVTYIDVLIDTCYKYRFALYELLGFEGLKNATKDKYVTAKNLLKAAESKYTSRESMKILSELYSNMVTIIDSAPEDDMQEHDINYFYKKSLYFAKKAYGRSNDIDNLDKLSEAYIWYSERYDYCDFWEVFSKIKHFILRKKGLSIHKKKLRILKKLMASEPQDYAYDVVMTYSDISDLCFPIFSNKYLRKALELCKEIIKNDDDIIYHETYDDIAEKLGVLGEDESCGQKAYYTKKLEALKALIQKEETTEKLYEFSYTCYKLSCIYMRRENYSPIADLMRQGFNAQKRICEISGSSEAKLKLCEYAYSNVCTAGRFRSELGSVIDNAFFIEILEEALAIIGDKDTDGLDLDHLEAISALYYNLEAAYTMENNSEKAEYYASEYKRLEEKIESLKKSNV